MALESIHDLMRAARRGGYAVGYFESWNLESLQGVLDAAEETRSPIILGFNGDFLSAPNRSARERLALYAALGKAAAESASVPCGLIFNECPNDEWTRKAITFGFNVVGVAHKPVRGRALQRRRQTSQARAAALSYKQRIRAIVRVAHQRGVCVEAELDELPCGASANGHAGGTLSDPARAAAFVEATGVDLLAVSVGNVHIKVNGEQPLDLDRLAAIQKRVPIPLALHGGTGIAADSLREAVALGVAKVNYGTYLKQRYLGAVRVALGVRSTDFRRTTAADPPEGGTMNPHKLLGMGGPEDVMVVGRRAVRDAVLERIEVLGCCRRA